MSTEVNKFITKAKSKAYKSKSIDHILNYSLIKTPKDYLLTYSFVNFFYLQLLSVYNLFTEKVIIPYSIVYDNVTYVDTKFDEIVLNRIDNVLAKLPEIKEYSPSKVYTKATATVKTGVLKPTNEYIYNTYDKYLPATVTENKVTFKLDSLTEDSEISKFFKIVNEFLSRAKALVSNKSTEVSNSIVSSYNNEVNELNDKYTGISKNVVASYNTSVNVVKGLNKEYIKPLKVQTQDYVTEVATNTKNRTDSLLSDAKQQLSPTINKIEGQVKDLLNGSGNTTTSNGNILVNASA